MKKQPIFVVFYILAMLVITFSACGLQGPSSPSDKSAQATHTVLSATPRVMFTGSGTSTSEYTLTPVPTPTLLGGGSIRLAYVSCSYKSIAEGDLLLEVTDRDSCEIYSINTDGSDQINLTNNNVPDADPDPSPDGTKIAYVSGAGDNTEIFVMNVDGTNKIQLTDNTHRETEPAWSPDGTQLVFVSGHFNGPSEIKIVTADGSAETTIAESGPTEGQYLSPDWSPLSTQIAFVWEGFEGFTCQGCSEIFVMNVDGSNLTQITHNNAWSQYPAWSPDGMKIAYETYAKPGNIAIVAINPDGSGQTELANTEGWDSQPSWSPDGRMIAFQSDRGRFVVADFDVYVINIDGSGMNRLTENANSSSPVWLP